MTLPVLMTLHGNPGFPEDWNSFLQAWGTSGVAPQLEEESIVAAAEKLKHEPWGLLAYSFGAYKALKILSKHADLRPSFVCLVAPYLESDSPLSGTAQFLISTPFLSNVLIRRSLAKWKDEFLKRMFSGSDVTTLPEVTQYAQRLDDPELWRRVIARKIEQQHEPLKREIKDPPPLFVVHASRDRISSKAGVEDLLNDLCPRFESLEISEAGHGLLWTHPSELSRVLRESLAKKGIL